MWPGPKAPECKLWLGVLNGADLDVVRQHFAAIPWRVPSAVQLFVMDQEQLFFRVWMIRDGRLRQYSPDGPDENDEGFWSATDMR